MELSLAQGGRNRRLLSGIVSGLVGRGIALVAPLLVMPAMLPYLGVKQFGLWMTIVSLTSMTLFMDLGLGNGLMTRLANCYGKDDLQRAREYVSSAYAVLVKVAVALLLLILLANYIGLLAYWLPDSSVESDSGESKLAIVCLAAFALSIPVSLIQRIQYAYQQAWLSNVWQALGAAVSVLVTLWAVQERLSGWIVVACYSLTPVMVLGISSIIFFSSQKPEIAPHPKFVTRKSAIEMLSLGSRFLMLAVLTSIALNLDNLIIANQLGLTAVADYVVPAKLTAILGMLITAVFLPLWPATGEALARKDYAWVKSTTRRMSFWGGIIVGLAALGLFEFNESIMKLWMGRTFLDQDATIGWLVLFPVLMAICSPYLMVMNSAGLLKLQIVGWLLYLLISAMLKYYFVLEMGIVSVAAISALCYFAFIVPASLLGAKQAMQ